MAYEEINLPRAFSLVDAAQAIEDAAAKLDLRVTQRGTLTEHPGSIHWHFKRGRESGTLEATLLNRERRIALSVRDNRRGAWTDDALQSLAVTLQDDATARDDATGT
jgi:hypothetical protein